MWCNNKTVTEKKKKRYTRTSTQKNKQTNKQTEKQNKTKQNKTNKQTKKQNKTKLYQLTVTVRQTYVELENLKIQSFIQEPRGVHLEADATIENVESGESCVK